MEDLVALGKVFVVVVIGGGGVVDILSVTLYYDLRGQVMLVLFELVFTCSKQVYELVFFCTNCLTKLNLASNW